MTPADAFALAKMPAARITRTTLLAVLEGIPEDNDAIYRAAGSVHGCALYHGVDLWVSVADVSRRNAVDTIIDWMALHGVSGADKILFTTGRLTAEIVMKVARSGIPIIVSRKGVT
jgi:FdhD protein